MSKQGWRRITYTEWKARGGLRNSGLMRTEKKDGGWAYWARKPHPSITSTYALPTGYTPAGERDGWLIFVRWHNPVTGRGMRWPDVLLRRADADHSHVFPAHEENMTHGGRVDTFLRTRGKP